LVKAGRVDLRFRLGLALSNRIECQVALGFLAEAAEDLAVVRGIYDQSAFGEESRLEVWDAANKMAQRALTLILGSEVPVGRDIADVRRAWAHLCRQYGRHVLAPIVRATTGMARLAFPHHPPFSAEAARMMVETVADEVRGGYASEWLLWEFQDLQAFVAEHEGPLAAGGVPVGLVPELAGILAKNLKHKGGAVHVPK
jgi:hypothetical protein